MAPPPETGHHNAGLELAARDGIDARVPVMAAPSGGGGRGGRASLEHTPLTGSERLQVVVVLVLSVLIPAIGVGRHEYGQNEGDVLQLALQPLSTIFGQNFPDQSPLYFLLERWWVALFGAATGSTRILSILCSTVAVWFTYRLGRRMSGHRMAVVAAIGLVLSPGFYFHARNARIYALFLAAATASVFFAARWIEARRAADLRWYVLSCTLAIYSHFFGLGTTGLTGLWMVILVRREGVRAMGRVVAAGAAVALLVVPQLWRSFGALDFATLKAAEAGNTFMAQAEFPAFFLRVYRYLYFNQSLAMVGFPSKGLQSSIEGALWILMLALTLLGIRQSGRRYALLGVLYVLLPPIVLFVAAHRVDIRPRYALFLVPVSAPFVVGGLWSLLMTEARWQRGLGGIFALLLVSLFVSGAVQQNREEDAGYAEAMRYVSTVYQPGDLIAAVPFWHRSTVQIYTPAPVLPCPDEAALEANVGRARHIIVVLLRGGGGQYLTDAMKAWLAQNTREAEVKPFGDGIEVRRYTRDASVDAALAARGIPEGAVPPESWHKIDRVPLGGEMLPLPIFMRSMDGASAVADPAWAGVRAAIGDPGRGSVRSAVAPLHAPPESGTAAPAP